MCGMNFINLIRIQFIFGIEDQLILSYNPLTISDSLDFMRHFVPLKSVPYLIFGPAYQCRNVKGTILYLYDSIVPFCFTRYRPEKLFQKCIVADRMYVRPGFSMTMPSAHTVVAVDQYFLSNRLYALKEKVVGIFANSVSYVAPRSNLVHEDTFTLFPVSA